MTKAGLILLLFRESTDNLRFHTFVFYRCNGSLYVCVLSIICSVTTAAFVWIAFFKKAYWGSSWPKPDVDAEKQLEIEHQKEVERGVKAFWYHFLLEITLISVADL